MFCLLRRYGCLDFHILIWFLHILALGRKKNGHNNKKSVIPSSPTLFLFYGLKSSLTNFSKQRLQRCVSLLEKAHLGKSFETLITKWCPQPSLSRWKHVKMLKMLVANISLIIFYFKTLPQFKERQYMCLPGEKKQHLYKLDYLKLKI